MPLYEMNFIILEDGVLLISTDRQRREVLARKTGSYFNKLKQEERRSTDRAFQVARMSLISFKKFIIIICPRFTNNRLNFTY